MKALSSNKFRIDATELSQRVESHRTRPQSKPAISVTSPVNSNFSAGGRQARRLERVVSTWYLPRWETSWQPLRGPERGWVVFPAAHRSKRIRSRISGPGSLEIEERKEDTCSSN